MFRVKLPLIVACIGKPMFGVSCVIRVPDQYSNQTDISKSTYHGTAGGGFLNYINI